MSNLQTVVSQIRALPISRPMGRVAGTERGLIQVTGLGDKVCVGDRMLVHRRAGGLLSCEILQVETDAVRAIPETAANGIAINDRAVLCPPPRFAPSENWLGRIIDPFGQPLDGKALFSCGATVDLIASPPAAADRMAMGARLATGLSTLNTLLPIVQGQRVGLFAGSGVGKSHMLAQLARSMQTDVVVVAMIGERGREVSEFVRKVLGPDGMKRSVVLAATSDQSAVNRRRCAWAAMATAEYFRDQGKNVLFLADSITRFVEAHREIAIACGETAALRGFPPSIMPLITALCERAGPGLPGQGYITAVFSVLVAGSDMEEPVADIVRGVLDGHIVLNREIAERGRYPAIDVSKSVSRSLPDAATPAENAIISETRKLIGAYENSEIMIRAGLYAEGADPVLDQAMRVWPELDAFVGRPDDVGVQNSFTRLNLILRRAGIGLEKLG